MPDTFSSLLRLRLQQTGGNNNTWGANLNTAAFQLLEDAISGKVDITIAGSDVTLTTNNGTNDQSRYAILNLNGAPGAARNVIVPTLTKIYLVINSTTGGFSQTVKTLAGTGVSIAAGGRVLVACDGTNVVALQADVTGTVATATNALQLGGVLAAAYAQLAVSQNWTAGQAVNFTALTDAATVTATCLTSNNFRVVIAGNRVIALSSPKDGQQIDLWIVQDATGGRTVTWPANVRWVGGSTPVLSTAASAIDRFRLKYNLATDIWSGEALLNSGTTGATTYNITFDRNEQNVDVFARLGSPAGVVTVNVTIAVGVIISSLCRATPSLTFNGFASTSVVNLTNLGYVLGKGGRGGHGGFRDPDDGDQWDPSAGEDGGIAVYGPGSGRTFNITNGSGRIWSGGGGGGGGGANNTNNAQGGGGGGGAGAGERGEGAGANPGTKGSTGRSGAAGAGGAGAGVGGQAGGAGGAYGAAGTAGTNGTTVNGAAGGAAGKAIELNGGSASFISGNSSPNIEGAVS